MTRILVINDTQEILTLFQDILTDEGYEAVLYSSAIHDMDEVERQNADLIILDWIFAHENLGFQMLQKLKMRRSTASIPVIVCTAALQAVREMEGYLQSKGVQVVLKPFEIDDLLDSVKRALKTVDYPGAVNSAEPAASDKKTT